MNDFITSFCEFVLLIFIIAIFVFILYANCESKSVLYYKIITPYGTQYEEIAITNSEKCNIIYNNMVDKTNYGCTTKWKYIFSKEYRKNGKSNNDNNEDK